MRLLDPPSSHVIHSAGCAVADRNVSPFQDSPLPVTDGKDYHPSRQALIAITELNSVGVGTDDGRNMTDYCMSTKNLVRGIKGMKRLKQHDSQNECIVHN